MWLGLAGALGILVGALIALRDDRHVSPDRYTDLSGRPAPVPPEPAGDPGPEARPTIASMIDRDQVLHVAKLARLRLSDEEVDRMAPELSKILEHVERMDELDLEGVEPTSHVVTSRTCCARTSRAPA